MGALPTSIPISVEEFERIPDPPGGRYELHHGDLVFVTFPVRRHKDLQRRLRKLLERMAEPVGYIVDMEYPYQPLPQNEVWGADIACISGARHAAVTSWLAGSPELVIEVKSPSNKKEDLHDKAMTTLAGGGALEFWILDPDSRSVTVHRKASGRSVYAGDSIVPVSLFAEQLRLADIFVGMEPEEAGS